MGLLFAAKLNNVISIEITIHSITGLLPAVIEYPIEKRFDEWIRYGLADIDGGRLQCQAVKMPSAARLPFSHSSEKTKWFWWHRISVDELSSVRKHFHLGMK